MLRAPLSLLYLNVLVIATCGLIYELLAGTLASYVLGDSVTQFSTIIGVYLSAMGVGAWVSGFVKKQLARVFLEVELGVALLGGTSAPLLFLSFTTAPYFTMVLYVIVFSIGVLVGLELPLLMRILKEHLDFGELVSRVLTFDYIGALVASVLFPTFFVPRLGLVRTSLLFGMLNALVALWGTWLLRPLLSPRGLAGLRGRSVLLLGLLLTGFIKADSITSLAEEGLFPHPVVFALSTPYQRIVVTQGPTSFQLYLNGNLQFNSVDEYRYHEALVHPVLAANPQAERILVLGGGDGLAVRELLRYSSVKEILLIDIDPQMTSLSKKFPPLHKLNGGSLADPRVTVINHDAMWWLETADRKFDAAIIDFPDPNTFALGKLYTTRFFRLFKARLTDTAMVSIQCTSPVVARSAYWCVLRTMESVGFHVRPYCAAVPSFGLWGYALLSQQPFPVPSHVPSEVASELRFLNDAALASLFDLSVDLGPVEVEINRLDNQALVRYYEAEWGRWN